MGIKGRERGEHMKGRKQVLTWTFLSVFLFAQTVFFCAQGETLFWASQSPAYAEAERGAEVQPVSHALVHRQVKTFLHAVKKTKSPSIRQNVWQQAAMEKEPEENRTYGRPECGHVKAKTVPAVGNALRAPPFEV